MKGLDKTFCRLNLKDMEMFDIDHICSVLQREKLDKKNTINEIQNEMSTF